MCHFTSGMQVIYLLQVSSAQYRGWGNEYNDITVNWIYVKCKVDVVSGQFLFELTFVLLGPYKSLRVSFKP